MKNRWTKKISQANDGEKKKKEKNALKQSCVKYTDKAKNCASLLAGGEKQFGQKWEPNYRRREEEEENRRNQY